MPNKTETVLLELFATTKSSLPSPLRSAVAGKSGDEPAGMSVRLKNNEAVDIVIGKKTALERPPPGLGLSTVTEAVLAVAMSDARMLTVNCELLTNVVARAPPFQFTEAPET